MKYINSSTNNCSDFLPHLVFRENQCRRMPSMAFLLPSFLWPHSLQSFFLPRVLLSDARFDILQVSIGKTQRSDFDQD